MKLLTEKIVVLPSEFGIIATKSPEMWNHIHKGIGGKDIEQAYRMMITRFTF